MKQYIGTKVVEAEPATLYELKDGGHYLKKHSEEWPEESINIPELSSSTREGYAVRYADGYESWSPKDVFERAYLPITANENLKTNKPSISQQMVDDFIDQVEVQTMGEKTTVVRAVLKNGFEIVEASSCVSPENYDENLGADICLHKIKDKVWMLQGRGSAFISWIRKRGPPASVHLPLN